jgi:hypothetical protein
MIRTYPEIQQVMRRIEAIVHKYVPGAEVKIFNSNKFYAVTDMPSLPSDGGKVIIRFSRMLVESGTWEQIEETMAHEIAHVLQADSDDLWATGKDFHSKEWEDIAWALGEKRMNGELSYYPDVLYPPRYKYRCADCGYTTNVPETRRRPPEPLFDVTRHGMKTGHYKWYVLDEVTGRRWTETH